MTAALPIMTGKSQLKSCFPTQYPESCSKLAQHKSWQLFGSGRFRMISSLTERECYLPSAESYVQTYCSFGLSEVLCIRRSRFFRSRAIARNECEKSTCIPFDTLNYLDLYPPTLCTCTQRCFSCLFAPTAANTPPSQSRAQIIHANGQLHARRVAGRAARIARKLC